MILYPQSHYNNIHGPSHPLVSSCSQLYNACYFEVELNHWSMRKLIELRPRALAITVSLVRSTTTAEYLSSWPQTVAGSYLKSVAQGIYAFPKGIVHSLSVYFQD